MQSAVLWRFFFFNNFSFAAWRLVSRFLPRGSKVVYNEQKPSFSWCLEQGASCSGRHAAKSCSSTTRQGFYLISDSKLNRWPPRYWMVCAVRFACLKHSSMWNSSENSSQYKRQSGQWRLCSDSSLSVLQVNPSLIKEGAKSLQSTISPQHHVFSDWIREPHSEIGQQIVANIIGRNHRNKHDMLTAADGLHPSSTSEQSTICINHCWKPTATC